MVRAAMPAQYISKAFSHDLFYLHLAAKTIERHPPLSRNPRDAGARGNEPKEIEESLDNYLLPSI